MQRYLIQNIHLATDGIPDKLDRNENYLVVRIGDNWFSYTRKGNAIMFHLFSLAPNALSQSCSSFIDWVFNEHEWCKMLIITLNKNSLYKLAKKHKFETILHRDNEYFMVRCR
jgi:hypothetical protein